MSFQECAAASEQRRSFSRAFPAESLVAGARAATRVAALRFTDRTTIFSTLPSSARMTP